MRFVQDFNPEISVASPGRINIIGEHTDYNRGFALPAAIDLKINLKFQRNGFATTCNLFSKGYGKGFTLELNNITKSDTAWENYILGVLHELTKKNVKLRGFDCIIESSLPSGSGLSSSAALECGLAYGLNELFSLGLDKKAIIELSQRAERSFVGTQCGIMDQFASVMSKTGHVILLDCQTMEHRYIPINIAPYKIIMLNTNVSHDLATSEYNTRKKECEQGLRIVQKSFPDVQSLRDVTWEMLEAHKAKMPVTIYNRCSFIIAENKRVLMTVEALRSNDLKKVGVLLYEAHEGLRSLYEVSCQESDFLVDFSKSHTYILGARQTGGGFGGCVLNLVHEEEVRQYVAQVSEAYFKKFNRQLTSFEAVLGPGTELIR